MDQARFDLPARAAQLAGELLQADLWLRQAAAARAEMFEGTPEAAVGDLVVDERVATFGALADQVADHDPIAQIVLRAVVAYAAADRDATGAMTALFDGDCVQKPAAELIQAVLELAEIRPSQIV